MSNNPRPKTAYAVITDYWWSDNPKYWTEAESYTSSINRAMKFLTYQDAVAYYYERNCFCSSRIEEIYEEA